MAELDNKPAIKLLEQAVPKLFDTQDSSFTEDEKEIIESLYKINEKAIFKIFSKEKTQKLFYDKLTNEFARTHIRPYIEKHIAAVIKQLSTLQIPFYYKDPNYSNIYETDQITFHRAPSDALFQFSLAEDELTYTLKIFSENKKLELKRKDIIELSVDPATLLIDNHLYRFDNIDSKKFRPFKEKDFISVPQRSIETYMSSFVKNSILNHKVEANGFTIESTDETPEAILALENDLALNPALTLNFKYGNRLFSANTKSKVFVKMVTDNNQYTFTKLKRDDLWENKIKELLLSMGLKETNNTQFLLSGDSELSDKLNLLISWINENSDKLKEHNINIIQEKFDEKYYTERIIFNFNFSENEDWFDINSQVKIGEFEIPFYKFRKHIINGTPEYTLPDGQIFIIPQEWFSKYSDILHHATIKDKKLKLNRIFFNLLNTKDDSSPKQTLPEKLRLLFGSLGKKEKIPKLIKATLRPYQADGYSWLHTLSKNSFGGILADDMGLGKTLQTIALITKLHEKPEKKSSQKLNNQPEQLSLFASSTSPESNVKATPSLPASLIVMPTSLIHNWNNEITKFAPHLKIYTYTGNNRLRTKDIGKILKHYHIVLTTYGIVRNDIEYLQTYNFHYTILDESQYVKNPASKTYLAVTLLRSKHRLVLTGTPIENSLSDLWTQMNFVNPGLLGNFNRFKKYYIAPITKKNSVEKGKKLKILIDPFILRRTKEMVAKDLPEMTEQIVYCDMTQEQKEFYEREKSGVRNKIAGIFNVANNSAILVLQALTKLRQAANHPVLVDEDYDGSSGKFEQVISSLENIVSEKHKVLVFSSFVKNLNIIEKQLTEKEIKYSKLTGETVNREEAINKFTKDEDCRVFLISLKAGGVGLNLVEADYVFILNPWWNPAAESQAVSRAHRIGQTKKVFVYRFISTETIEEKITHLQKKKQKLADTFITTENLLKNLTKEEFEKLLA
jgi:SNF2 family DNA or RNA helicase